MHFPDFLQFFLDCLTNAEHVIRRDRLMSSPTLKVSNYFIYMLGVHVYRTLKGNISYAHDNRDMPIYLVLSLITSDKLANNQEFDIHVIQLTRF